jgi:hypothetical protein
MLVARQRPTAAESFKSGLRWIAVLPGAILAGLLLTFPLHWMLYRTLTGSGFIEPYPELPERLLSPGVFAGGMVFFGSRIAPHHKTEAAAVLFGIVMVLLGVSVAIAVFEVPIAGRTVTLDGGGVASAGAFIGGLVGFLLARRKAEPMAGKVL